MKNLEDEQNIHGIIIIYKIYNEHNALIGVLNDESSYIKGYVKHANYTPGQQIIGRITSVSGYTKFFVDSIENSLAALFWNDSAKLFKLMYVLNSIDTLPENIILPGLYDEFLSIIAKILVDEADLKSWDEYVLNL